ncbi:acyl-CoA dehydrogenase/oxidase [Pisolithus thermaeus]|nr:acyl-CoA dehydrogenase/oxidase [Pisolithus thermaeus]
MAAKELKEFTLEEVAQWVIIDGKVYDLTRFKDLHPGGISVLTGKDATDTFYGLHRHEVLERPQYKRLQVGTVKGQKSVIFGRRIGRTEPSYHSPYYSDNHRQFQKAVRRFIDEVVYPDAQAREEDGKRPSQIVFDKMADLNLHAMRLGPGKHLKGRVLMGGIVKPEELIITQELVRCGARGYGDGMLGGQVIGLPPVLNFGSPELQARIVPDILAGKKFICLAISEAAAGSDVMGLQTTAVLSEDGKEWIINGTKKWITNGTTNVRVARLLHYILLTCFFKDGLTVILVERGPGVETRQIKTSYSTAAGTAYITFDNVRVPVGNTLGEVGGGIFVILSNFNHERWVMCCSSARAQRTLIEECLKWATQRQAFGKPLISQPVIRAKIAGMIERTESVQSWLENITYQMTHMTYKQQSQKLAGPIAFLKSYSTRCAQDTARDAVQVFGGRGITKTGMGKFVEHYYRTVTFDSLLGGGMELY